MKKKYKQRWLRYANNRLLHLPAGNPQLAPAVHAWWADNPPPALDAAPGAGNPPLALDAVPGVGNPEPAALPLGHPPPAPAAFPVGGSDGDTDEEEEQAEEDEAEDEEEEAEQVAVQ